MYLQQAVDFSASENIFPAATKKKQSFVTVHTTDKTPTQTTHANNQSHYANKYNWKTEMIFLVTTDATTDFRATIL